LGQSLSDSLQEIFNAGEHPAGTSVALNKKKVKIHSQPLFGKFGDFF